MVFYYLKEPIIKPNNCPNLTHFRHFDQAGVSLREQDFSKQKKVSSTLTPGSLDLIIEKKPKKKNFVAIKFKHSFLIYNKYVTV